MPESFFSKTWTTADASPPLAALTHLGHSLAPGSSYKIASNPGRVKVELNHAGTAGRVWIGVGQPAEVGVGNYIDFTDTWWEWTDQDIYVLLDGATGAQPITGMEWAA